jgi:hypothetical protein
MTMIATVLALVVPANHDQCHTTACAERVAMHHCAKGYVPACVRRGALHWHVSYPMLMRKARCESRLDPQARNGTHVGIFQFDYPGTWRTTPYARRSPWRAKWSSLAAGYMHHVGRGGEWSCQ